MLTPDKKLKQENCAKNLIVRFQPNLDRKKKREVVVEQLRQIVGRPPIEACLLDTNLQVQNWLLVHALAFKAKVQFSGECGQI